MNLGELVAKIGADTSKLEVAQLKANLLYNNIGTSTAKMEGIVKQSWEKIAIYSGLIVGAIYSVQRTFSTFEEVAKAEDISRSFKNLTTNIGANSEKIISSLKRVSGETLSISQIISLSSRAILLGLDPDTISRLMEIARASTKATGQSITAAFEDITLGVARQSKMILDNLGILLDYDKHLKRMQTQLGKSEDALSDLERRQAFLNATFEAGAEIVRKVGNSFGTTYDKITQQKAAITDLTNEIKTLTFESSTYLFALQQIRGALEQIKGIGEVWKFVSFEKSNYGDLFDLIGGNKLLDFLRSGKESLDNFENSIASATPKLQGFVNWFRELFGLAKLGVVPFEQLSDRIKNLQFKFPVDVGLKVFEKEVDMTLSRVDNKIAKTNELLKQMGTTTKEGLAFKISELKNEAEKYKEAKVDEILIDKWYYTEVRKNLESFVNYRSSLIEKEKEEDIITASEKNRTYKTMYDDLGKDVKSYYVFQEKLLLDQFEEEVRITKDRALAYEVYTARKKELDLEYLRHFGSATDGVKLFFEEESEKPQSWASEVSGGLGDLKSAMSDAATSIVRQTDSISGAFRNMANSILDSLAKIGTNMMINALFSAVGGAVGGAFAGGVSGAGTGTIGSSYTGGAGSTISSGGGVNYNGITGTTAYSRNTQPSGSVTNVTNNYIDATDAESFQKLLKRNKNVLNGITAEGKRKSRNFEKSLR